MMILHGIYGQKEILITTVVGMSTIPTVSRANRSPNPYKNGG